MALAEGLDGDPKRALERSVAKFEALSRKRGTTPHIRMTVAFSDGQRLFAVRYASDDRAPTLYHRWSDSRGGRAVVSEPLEADETDWVAVPPGSFCRFEGDSVEMEPFSPDVTAEMAA